MGISNTELVNRIDTAIKAITVSDMGSSILQTEKATRFVRAVQSATPMLNECRLITMESEKRDIDRIGFGSRIMKNPSDANLESKPSTNTNQLDTEEAIAIVGIEDTTLEENIEGGNFENTLLDMIGDRAGLDMEEAFINGDKGSSDTYLALIDGWNKLASNQLDGQATTPDFDATNVEDMFNKLLHGVPPKYIRRRSDWRYYTSWKIEDDYREVLKARGTGLGDEAQTNANRLKYKGIPVVPVPNMPEGTAQLTNPNNNVYGIRREIRIEPDRIPKQRKTDFVLTVKFDAHFEDENATAVAAGYTG